MGAQPFGPGRPPAAFVPRRLGKPLMRVRRAMVAGPEAVLVGGRRVDDAGIVARPADADEWLARASRYEGSWWPWWTDWLDKKGGGKKVAARSIKDGIEPAPGRYVMMP